MKKSLMSFQVINVILVTSEYELNFFNLFISGLHQIKIGQSKV